MPIRTSYAQGTPNWVDLQTTNQDAAKAFYAGLFGWTYDDQPMPQGPVYSMATTAPQMPGVPNHWQVYFEVADADAAVAKAAELGGEVLIRPFDLPVGRMAVISDPQGAVFSIIKSAPQPA